jgi:hypothetical protein
MLQLKAGRVEPNAFKAALNNHILLEASLKAAAEKRPLHQDTIGSPNPVCLQKYK